MRGGTVISQIPKHTVISNSMFINHFQNTGIRGSVISPVHITITINRSDRTDTDTRATERRPWKICVDNARNTPQEDRFRRDGDLKGAMSR